MGRTLIITEKPSVAREYAKILGAENKGDGYIENDQYVISWCLGHLVEMSYPDAYDESYGKWTLDGLPFLPTTYKYEVISEPASKKQFGVLKKYMNDPGIDTIYYGGDSGREGEHIGRLVRKLAGVRSGITEKRIWIDSFTEDEIKRGMREAKPLSDYDLLADSAEERAIEDYATGINFTRALTLAYRGYIDNKLQSNLDHPVTVGRVMTCVLGMVVDRERAIRAFVPSDFYKVVAEADTGSGQGKFKWKVAAGSEMFESPKLYNEEGFKKEEDAQAFIGGLPGKLNIDKVTKTVEKKKPPFLYSLSELQNDCTKLFKIGPDETLAIAQSLYEKKLTTYPRTDARVLSSAVAKEIDKTLAGLKAYGGEIGGFCDEVLTNGSYKGIGSTQYTDDSKITDHYAIIPTNTTSAASSINDLERKVYELICRRFLSIFYPAAEFTKYSIEATTEHGAYKEPFSATAKQLAVEGFFKVAGAPKQDEGVAELYAAISTLKEGISLFVSYSIAKGTTQPPKRYTSGSMVLAMENAGNLIEDEELRAQIKGSGIGTSATRAETISKLNRLGYIATDKKTQALSATNVGELIYDVVNDMLPDLLSPKMTASWEKGLELVRTGECAKDKYESTIVSYVRDKIAVIKEKAAALPASERFQTEVICPCPICGKDIVKGKKSYYCLGYKELTGEKDADGKDIRACNVGVQIEILGAKISSDEAKKLFSGEMVTKKLTSKEKGTTWSQRLKFSKDEQKVVFDKDGIETNYSCPACKSKLTDMGMTLECSCGVKIWKKAGEKILSEKTIKELLEKGKTSLVKGLKSKKGTSFDAYLVLQPDGKVNYEFPPRD